MGYRTFGVFCVSVTNAISCSWAPEKSIAILHVQMQLLRDVIHCDYSFVIHNPLAKIARLRYSIIYACVISDWHFR